MFFYLVLFFSACLFAFLYSREKRQHVAILWKFICFSILFIPAALRFNVGVDYPTYAKIFNYIANGVPILVEPGYWFLNYAVFKLNGGFQIVVAFCSFFTLLFVFLSFPKKHFLSCIAIFFLVFYPWTYTTIRQMLVASLAYYCYIHYFLNGKFLRSYLIFAFASVFHLSALIYIPIFFLLRYIRINKIYAFLFFTLVLVTAPVADIIIGFFEIALANTKYSVYFSMDSMSGKPAEISTGIGRIVRFFLYTLILLPLVIYRDKRAASDGLVLFLIVIVFDVLAQHIVVFSRISRGFLFAYFILIVAILESKSKYRQIVVLSIFALSFVLYIGNLYNEQNLPYQTIAF